MASDDDVKLDMVEYLTLYYIYYFVTLYYMVISGSQNTTTISTESKTVD